MRQESCIITLLPMHRAQWNDQPLSLSSSVLLGTREIYDYGKPLPLERVILTSVWSIFTVGLFSRVFWQLLNGNRNLF